MKRPTSVTEKIDRAEVNVYTQHGNKTRHVSHLPLIPCCGKRTCTIGYETSELAKTSPYVKGLPTNMHIREKLEDGTFKESVIRRTYEDAYTLEMKELYAFAALGKTAKTTAVDARQDLEIFGMIMKVGQAGLVRK